MKRRLRISNRKKLAMINTVVFSTVLAIFGIFFFVFPRQDVSDFEKRKLSPWPQYSLDSMLYGKYIDSIDLFAADHFPFREELVELSSILRTGVELRMMKSHFTMQLTSNPTSR